MMRVFIVKGNYERGRNKARNVSSDNKSRSRKIKDIECYKCEKRKHKARLSREEGN